MIKKNPSYRVTIFTQYESIIIEYPISCKFNSQRAIYSEANKCTVDLYNLAPSTRRKIFQDIFPVNGEYKYIKLEAGWNGTLSQIFAGKILQAYSSKSGGDVDIVTHIECQPYDVFDSKVSVTIEKGTTYKEAYKIIASTMPNVKIGHIGTLEGTFDSQTTFEGTTIECLNKLTGGNTFVDNGILNTVMSNEVIEVQIPSVTDENGLLASPERRDATLSIKMLFEPTLIVGQLMEIKSSILPEFNGQYKVMGFTHDCTISPTQSGTRTTTVDLHVAPLLFEQNLNQTEGQPTGGAAPVGGYNVVSGENVVPANCDVSVNVKEVYDYIQKNNGKIPNTKITNNIWWKEMLGNDNTDEERKKECTIQILTNCSITAKKFQEVLDKYYKGTTVIVTSGWRSDANNIRANGERDSKHKRGLAIDFYLQGQSLTEVYALFNRVWPGYVGYYAKRKFIHAQVDRV